MTEREEEKEMRTSESRERRETKIARAERTIERVDAGKESERGSVIDRVSRVRREDSHRAQQARKQNSRSPKTVASSCTVKNGESRRDVTPRDVFLPHMTLHQSLVNEEVRSAREREREKKGKKTRRRNVSSRDVSLVALKILGDMLTRIRLPLSTVLGPDP